MWTSSWRTPSGAAARWAPGGGRRNVEEVKSWSWINMTPHFSFSSSFPLLSLSRLPRERWKRGSAVITATAADSLTADVLLMIGNTATWRQHTNVLSGGGGGGGGDTLSVVVTSLTERLGPGFCVSCVPTLADPPCWVQSFSLSVFCKNKRQI